MNDSIGQECPRAGSWTMHALTSTASGEVFTCAFPLQVAGLKRPCLDSNGMYTGFGDGSRLQRHPSEVFVCGHPMFIAIKAYLDFRFSRGPQIALHFLGLHFQSGPCHER